MTAASARPSPSARAQQNSLWNRQQLSNQLHALLREYYPAARTAFEPWRNGLRRPQARELLKAAPTPSRTALLTRMQLEAALKRAGRKRGITVEGERLRDVPRADAHQPPLAENALGNRHWWCSWRPPAPPSTTSSRRSMRLSSAPKR